MEGNQRSLHHPCSNSARWRSLRTAGYQFHALLFSHAALFLYLRSIFQIIRRLVRIYPTENKQVDYPFSFLLSKRISNEIYRLENSTRGISTACIME